MTHEQALAAVRAAVAAAVAPISVVAADDHGEPVALVRRFSFFLGDVAAFSGGARIGAVGVSGLPGPDDEALAVAAIRAAGLEPPAGL